MDQILTTFATGTAWSWLVLGLALVIAEVVAPTFWLLWPGLSALAIGLVTVLTGPFDWRIQGLLFTLLAIALTVAGRRFVAARAKTPREAPSLNRRAEQYKGRVVRVTESFAGGRGRVAVDDTAWLAHAVDATNPASGEAVEVVGVEGTVLRVKSAGAAS
jgi:membrane protein implicated in regulation of membrane protease activity